MFSTTFDKILCFLGPHKMKMSHYFSVSDALRNLGNPPPPAPRFLVWKASPGHIPRHLEGEGGKLVIQGEFLKLLQLEQSDIALKSIIYGVPKRVMAFVVRAASNTRYNCVQLENSLFKINFVVGRGVGLVWYSCIPSFNFLLWLELVKKFTVVVSGRWVNLKSSEMFYKFKFKSLGLFCL